MPSSIMNEGNEWNDLLNHLAEVPRENGTSGIHQAASYLAESYRAAGIEVQTVPGFCLFSFGGNKSLVLAAVAWTL
jgi:hypothetical protein